MKDTISYIFKHPVIKVYKVNQVKPSFIIIPNKIKIAAGSAEKVKSKVSGEIQNLHVLEGNESFLQLTTSESLTQFIFCWEVKENGERKWKKLVNVTFPEGLSKFGGLFLAEDFRTRGLRPDKPYLH